MSDSVQSHRRQPTRLPRPWDSPGKNTGVGCHLLLQCRNVKSESEVAQSCRTLSDPMNCNPPGSSIHGIFQARVLDWGAIKFGGSQKLYMNFQQQGRVRAPNNWVVQGSIIVVNHTLLKINEAGYQHEWNSKYNI